MEKYFCIFINYQQDDWLKKLAIIEFAANNNKSTSIKPFLFFTTKDLHLFKSFDIIKLSDVNICKQIFKQKTLIIFGNI